MRQLSWGLQEQRLPDWMKKPANQVSSSVLLTASTNRMRCWLHTMGQPKYETSCEVFTKSTLRFYFAITLALALFALS